MKILLFNALFYFAIAVLCFSLAKDAYYLYKERFPSIEFGCGHEHCVLAPFGKIDYYKGLVDNSTIHYFVFLNKYFYIKITKK